MPRRRRLERANKRMKLSTPNRDARPGAAIDRRRSLCGVRCAAHSRSYENPSAPPHRDRRSYLKTCLASALAPPSVRSDLVAHGHPSRSPSPSHDTLSPRNTSKGLPTLRLLTDHRSPHLAHRGLHQTDRAPHTNAAKALLLAAQQGRDTLGQNLKTIESHIS